MMQNGRVIMPIALPSLENETVMPNREKSGKRVGKKCGQSGKSLLKLSKSSKRGESGRFIQKKLPCLVS